MDPVLLVDPQRPAIATDKRGFAGGRGCSYKCIVRGAACHRVVGQSENESLVSLLAQPQEWLRKPCRQEIADQFSGSPVRRGQSSEHGVRFERAVLDQA